MFVDADASVVDGATPPRPMAIGGGSGANHTCAVMTDGSIRCWGSNGSGELGDTTTVKSFVAVPVKNPPPNKTFVEVTCGQQHSCARAASGEVYCWGANWAGMIGDGTLAGRYDPTLSTGVAAATSVSTSTTTTCALDGTKTKCWGTPSNGALARLGDNTTPDDALEDGISTNLPILDATAVTVGEWRACVIQDGGVKCWGNNNVGQSTGNPDAGIACTPTSVTGLETGASLVRAGPHHTCAIMTAGNVKCWGMNAHLCLGAWGGPDVVDVPQLPDPVSDLALGERHTCALTTKGEVFCWGSNEIAQIGMPPDASYNSPTKVGGISNVVQIAAGSEHTCALLQSGEVDCWGSNLNGALGGGLTADFSATPVKVLGL